MGIKAIELVESYVGRGAPSNAAGSRRGIGRTRAEAHQAAEHWANQSPWACTRRIVVLDDPNDMESERIAWDTLRHLDGEYLPQTKIGAEIIALLREGKYASAFERYFAAIDAGEELVGR